MKQGTGDRVRRRVVIEMETLCYVDWQNRDWVACEAPNGATVEVDSAFAFGPGFCEMREPTSIPPEAEKEDGWTDWIHPEPGYVLACCDCGLRHRMDFRIAAVTTGR